MSSHGLFAGINIDLIPKRSYFLEIGCVRDQAQFDSGDNSTLFFDQLAQKHGYGFMSVDFSKDSVAFAQQIVGDRAYYSDGTEFIKKFKHPIGILYLDNFDIIYSDKHRESIMSRVGEVYGNNNEVITNERSAQVHLEQMQAALSKMTRPCYVCIDDTMVRDNGWFGKGATVVPFLLNQGFKIINQNDSGVLMFSGSVTSWFKIVSPLKVRRLKSRIGSIVRPIVGKVVSRFV